MGLGLDRDVPNRQFLQVATALGSELTSGDVQALVQKQPMLKYHQPAGDQVGLLSTPPHFGALNWVAWLEFGSDGRGCGTRSRVSRSLSIITKLDNRQGLADPLGRSRRA
jgi:hypothetical protein